MIPLQSNEEGKRKEYIQFYTVKKNTSRRRRTTMKIEKTGIGSTSEENYFRFLVSSIVDDIKC